MDAEQKFNAELRKVTRKAELERVSSEIAALEPLQRAFAALDRARYQALIEQGFTEKQALELIKR